MRRDRCERLAAVVTCPKKGHKDRARATARDSDAGMRVACALPLCQRKRNRSPSLNLRARDSDHAGGMCMPILHARVLAPLFVFGVLSSFGCDDNGSPSASLNAVGPSPFPSG